ncbi:MAG: sugar-binding protein [Treponema sp.]|nr:sugar-binding protein [Treponema sp.]
MRKVILISLVLVLLASVFVFAGGGQQGAGKKIVGIALPTKEQPIWPAQGNALTKIFTDAGYQVIIEYAEDMPERQIMQIENMITRGCKYLIITAVDTFSLTDICEKAKDAGIKIISSDRLIMNTKNVDYYVSFDLIRNGILLGEGVEKGLGLKEGKKGPFTLEIFSGSPDDSNSVPFYDGAMSVLKKYLDNGTLVVKSGQVSLGVTGILKWDSALAQARMDNILGAYYTDTRLDAVVAAADCLAIGIISSLDSMGYGKSADLPFPVVTGQDCEITAIKAIIAGQQYMSVYLDPVVMSEKMFGVVDSLDKGTAINPDAHYNNGTIEVPAITYDPVYIDKSNYNLLVERGFYTEADLR